MSGGSSMDDNYKEVISNLSSLNTNVEHLKDEVKEISSNSEKACDSSLRISVEFSEFRNIVNEKLDNLNDNTKIIPEIVTKVQSLEFWKKKTLVWIVGLVVMVMGVAGKSLVDGLTSSGNISQEDAQILVEHIKSLEKVSTFTADE
jgi:polyhydroxyalkanoate synthesis regulator phasin